MLLAMALTAVLCVGIGVWPSALYALLPYATDYIPYTDSHVLSQVQLLLFSALAFTVLMRTGIYPPELRSTNLDTEWFYRRIGRNLARGISNAIALGYAVALELVAYELRRLVATLRRQYGPGGVLARTWTTSGMVLWVAAMLGAYLVFYLV